jgi:glycosyl-4,4'-diaponeurosporenoate acyltransferase
VRAISSLIPLVSSAALWLSWSLVVGSLLNRLPLAWLQRPTPTGEAQMVGLRVALRRQERCWRIRHWKRWMPDAGNALPGGIRKASLARRDPAALQRLMAETRRAELVHWLLWPAWLFTLLWLPLAGVVLNLLFATAFNLPCLVLQRYNRLRLQRLLGCKPGAINAPANLPEA